jgi:non-heme chloroperoxidase
MAYVEVEPGVRMFYRDLGPGNAGRPVVLLHGWTMSHEVWDRQVRTLGAHHRVILPDLRGHGASDKPLGPYDPDRHAADVAALLDHLDLHDVTLLGWSFGGMVAMRAAAAYDERLAQVVLLNAAGPKYLVGDGVAHGHTPEDLAAWLVRERDDLASWRRFTMASMPVVPYDELFTHWLWTLSMRTPSWAAAPMLEAFARADLREDLDAITVPLLVVHGLHDAWCLPEAARYVAQRVAGAELVEFPECGHSPQWEDPAAFDAVLAAFLARVP